MALDRFIHWTDKRPSRTETEMVLINFLGQAAQEITWDKDRFFITLKGSSTFPFKGLNWHLEEAALERFAPPNDQRFIEVVLAQSSMDVITRQADEFTNVVAQGIAELFARYWSGKLEE